MFNRIHRYVAATSLVQFRVCCLQVRPISMASTSNVLKGVHTPSVTYMDAELSKLVDERLMEVRGFSIDQLMELAGYGVASAVVDHWENYRNLSPNKNIVIFCGPGNNGGDGLVAARHLKHFGFQPTIVYPKKGKTSLFTSLINQLKDLEVEVLDNIPDPTQYSTFGLAIDSLFGFSFQGPSREPFTSMIQQFAASPIPVFSVDIPSGWDVNRGDIHGTGFKPDAVISLTAPKLCMKDYSGVHYVGGRFVPPKLAAELGLTLPDYGVNSKQVLICTHQTCCLFYKKSPSVQYAVHASERWRGERTEHRQRAGKCSFSWEYVSTFLIRFNPPYAVPFLLRRRLSAPST